METAAEENLTGRNFLKVSAMKGSIKWYDSVKGYGFIQTEEDKDIFVHRTGLQNSQKELLPGDSVEFDIEEREKGPVAINVKKA